MKPQKNNLDTIKHERDLLKIALFEVLDALDVHEDNSFDLKWRGFSEERAAEIVELSQGGYELYKGKN